jgi:hypothetical protein
MTMSTLHTLSLVAVAALVSLAPAQEGAGFKAVNTPENLKSLFEQIHRAVHAQKNPKAAVALFRTLAPDEARLKQALREDAAANVTRLILDMHKQMPAGEAAVARLARPEQTEVRVHAATTEELARHERVSVAFKEFPAAAQRVARQALRPGVTFYAVEYLQPGRDAGMKYHLVYWDGRQWSMLGPVWRVLR